MWHPEREKLTGRSSPLALSRSVRNDSPNRSVLVPPPECACWGSDRSQRISNKSIFHPNRLLLRSALSSWTVKPGMSSRFHATRLPIRAALLTFLIVFGQSIIALALISRECETTTHCQSLYRKDDADVRLPACVCLCSSSEPDDYVHFPHYIIS